MIALSSRLGFARQILIPAHQLGETIVAGGEPHRELVHGRRGRGLGAALDHIERVVEGLSAGINLPLLLRIEQHRQARRASCARPLAISRSTSGSASAVRALRLIERGQIVQDRRGVGMVRADRAFTDRERALDTAARPRQSGPGAR